MTPKYVVVVGGGIVGLCTAWSLIRRGHRVTLLEQGATIPGPLSASGDEHRIIRRAYGAEDGYARNISEAFRAWDQLWTDLGQSHYVNTGVMVISQREGDQGDSLRAGLDRAGHPYALYQPPDVARAYPFLDAAALRYALVSAEGGVLLSERIARDLLSWLLHQGADMRTNAKVVAVDADQPCVHIADGDVLRADHVVVAAGAWTGGLLPELADRFTNYRTAVVYLEPPSDLRDAWSRAPAIMSRGPIDAYILPPVAGTGLKMGTSVNKRLSDPDAGRAPEPNEGETLRALFAPPFTRINEYSVARVVTCPLSFTQDERFVGQRIGRAGIAISACSGHGYKFGAAIGQRVADAVETEDITTLARWLRAENTVSFINAGTAVS